MDMLSKILSLIDERGIEQQELTDFLGINKQVITDWKGGRSKSYKKYVDRISEFFHVSADYLTGNEAPNESSAQNNCTGHTGGNRRTIFKRSDK